MNRLSPTQGLPHGFFAPDHHCGRAKTVTQRGPKRPEKVTARLKGCQHCPSKPMTNMGFSCQQARCVASIEGGECPQVRTVCDEELASNPVFARFRQASPSSRVWPVRSVAHPAVAPETVVLATTNLPFFTPQGAPGLALISYCRELVHRGVPQIFAARLRQKSGRRVFRSSTFVSDHLQIFAARLRSKSRCRMACSRLVLSPRPTTSTASTVVLAKATFGFQRLDLRLVPDSRGEDSER